MHHSHMSDITNILLREYLLALIVVNDIDLVPHNKSRMLFVLTFLNVYAVLDVRLTLPSTILLIEIKHLLMVLSLSILLLETSSDVFFLVATYYDARVALI